MQTDGAANLPAILLPVVSTDSAAYCATVFAALKPAQRTAYITA